MRREVLGSLAVFCILVAAGGSGCAEEVTGPTPSIPSPAAGMSLPVDPGLVCRHQLSSEILVTGEGLAPVPVGLPKDPHAKLPDLELVRSADVDGTPSDGSVLLWSGLPDGANASKLAWLSQRQMRFTLDQDLTLADGSRGLAPRGLYDLRVTNANGQSTTSTASIALIDKPTLAAPSPGIVCLAQGPREVALSGASLLRLDGADPNVAIEGAGDFALSDFLGCVEVPHAGLDADLCTGATLVLATNAVEPGYPGLTIENPETAACVSEELVNLRVVPPPVLMAADPPVVCTAEGPREVTLRGEGLLQIDGALPAVTMDGVALEVLGVSGCEPLTAMGHEVSRCTELDVRLPQTVHTALVRPTLVVTNPSPAGCDATRADILLLVPPPDITDIEPPTLCDDGSVQTLVVTGDWLFVIDGENPEVRVDEVATLVDRVAALDCEPVVAPAGIDVQLCTALSVEVDSAAIDDGAATIALTNPPPAGCSDTYVPDLPLVAPPEVLAVEPALVCDTDGERTLIVSGRNFLRVDGELPALTLGGVDVTVTAAGGCETTPIGPFPDLETCDTLTVTVAQASLPSGQPEIIVQNPYPAACASATSGPLTVPPRLSLTSATPNGICVNAAASTVTFAGEGFLRIDGAPPQVRLNEVDFDVTNMTGCVDLDVAGEVSIESCSAFDLVVDRQALGEPEGGVVTVAVDNGEPSGCGLAVSDVFFVTPVPDVSAVNPTAICADLPTIVRVLGSDFSPAADVVLTRQGQSLATDTTVTFVSANELEVAVPGGLEPGVYDVTVSNAQGCADTLPASLTLLPRPVVFFVDPPVVPNDLDLQVTVYVANINGGDVSQVQVRPLGSDTWVTVSHEFDPLRPTRVLATLPEGLIEDGSVETFEVTVQDGLGCPAALDGSLDLSRDLSLAPATVSPPFGGTDAATAVSIRIEAIAVGDRFVELPRAYLSPVTGEGLATPMASVGFVSPTELSALVPEGLVPGDYDVIVVNPDGAVGVVSGGFRVTAAPPPRIETIAPGSVPGPGTTVIIFGQDFDDAAVRLYCRAFDTPTSTPVERVVTGTFVSSSEVRFVVPSGVDQNDICLVRLFNEDGSFDTFSALVMLNPAENIPRQLDSNQPLITARRGLGAVVAGPTRSARFLYAVGGDTGTLEGRLASVEVSALTAFGELLPWRESAVPLPAARTLAGVVTLDRFIYVVGGDEGAGAVSSVLRAEVLRPQDAPEVEGELEIALDPDGLGPGLWYYRVSATLTQDDPDNPGGETLASEPVAVLVPPWAPDGFAITFGWSAVENAASYHIYRSPSAGSPLGGLVRIATVGAGVRRFSDDFEAPLEPVATPRRLGDLGAWRTLATLNTARADLGVALAADPVDRAVRYLYATGGRNTSGTELGTYEVLRIVLGDDGAQSPAPSWTTGNGTFAARRAHGLFAADATATTRFGANETWLYVGPGIGGANASRFVSAEVLEGGALSTWQSAFSGSVNRAGYGAAAAANQLFLFGGGTGATPDGSRDSGSILADGLLGNVNATGNTMLVARTRMGAAIGSGRMFMVGGATATGVTATVESAIW